ERSIAYQIEAPGKRLESCQSVQKGRMVFRLFHARDYYQSRRVSARVAAQRRRDVRHAVVNHRQFSSSRNAATQRQVALVFAYIDNPGGEQSRQSFQVTEDSSLPR